MPKFNLAVIASEVNTFRRRLVIVIITSDSIIPD
jgi:hypothetical protein